MRNTNRRRWRGVIRLVASSLGLTGRGFRETYFYVAISWIFFFLEQIYLSHIIRPIQI